MILVKNVKGIRTLEMDETKLSQLNKRIIGVYGANGAGKSSLKNAILRDDIVKNWELEGEGDFEQKIDPSIDYSRTNYAVFDERVVNLVRRKTASKVRILGDEVDNLYDLLTNRAKYLESKNAIDTLDKGILSIPDSIFNNVVLALEEIRWNFAEIKMGCDQKVMHYNFKIADLLFDAVSKILNPVIDSPGSLVSRGSNVNVYSFIGVKENKLFSLMNKMKAKNEITGVDIQNAKEFIIVLEIYFTSLRFVTANFGYVPLEGQLDSVVNNHPMIFGSRNAVNPSASKVDRFVALANQGNNLETYKTIWGGLLLTVEKVISTANNLLEAYDLNYSVKLNPTTIKSTEFGGNFALFHNLSNKSLSEAEIEKYVSFGELNIISLALFISSILVRGIKIGTTLIFDDPVSSYDLNRVQITINIIKSSLGAMHNVNKIVFLSHEKHFIKSLKLVFNREISYWNLIKGKTSELRYVESMQSDFELYKTLNKSDDKVTKLISERFFSEIKRQLPQGVNRTVREVNNEIYDQLDWEQIAVPTLETLKREDIISLKTKIKKKHPGFWGWVTSQAAAITLKISSDESVSDVEKQLYRAGMYKNILNSVNHSESGDDVSLDISRTGEKIDILYASRSKMMADLAFAISKFIEQA